MRYNEYSYRHGKELLQTLHPEIVKEIESLLKELPPYPHGKEKKKTAKTYLANAFIEKGWTTEDKVNLGTDKKDYVDIYKNKIAIEMEFSRFEMFFRDFFRFMLLYQKKQIDAGIILTLDDMAYEQWGSGVKSYHSARASFQRVRDFLEGQYSTIVIVPIWCIGIE